MGAPPDRLPGLGLQPACDPRVRDQATPAGPAPQPLGHRKQPAVLTGYPEDDDLHYEFGHAPGAGRCRLIWYDGGAGAPHTKGCAAEEKHDRTDGGVPSSSVKGIGMTQETMENKTRDRSAKRSPTRPAADVPPSCEIEGGMGGTR